MFFIHSITSKKTPRLRYHKRRYQLVVANQVVSIETDACFNGQIVQLVRADGKQFEKQTFLVDNSTIRVHFKDLVYSKYTHLDIEDNRYEMYYKGFPRPVDLCVVRKDRFNWQAPKATLSVDGIEFCTVCSYIDCDCRDVSASVAGLLTKLGIQVSLRAVASFVQETGHYRVLAGLPLLQFALEHLSKDFEVKPSTIEGAGDGLFAKRDLPEGYFIPYSGTHHATYDFDESNDAYVIQAHNRQASHFICGGKIIPNNGLVFTDQTLWIDGGGEWDAPKINDPAYNQVISNEVYNVEFLSEIEVDDSVRFIGVIARLTRDVKQGDEFFVNYRQVVINN